MEEVHERKIVRKEGDMDEPFKEKNQPKRLIGSIRRKHFRQKSKEPNWHDCRTGSMY